MKATKSVSTKSVSSKSVNKSVNKSATASVIINSNTTPFVVSRDEFKVLCQLFNKLYELKRNDINNLQRIDLWNSIYNDRLTLWQKLDTTKNSDITPYRLVSVYLKGEIDMIVGARIATTALATGEAVAMRVIETNSTGVNTFVVADVLPVIPGNAKMVKSLAKKQTANGKLFGIREKLKDGGISFTVYRVSVKEEEKDGKIVKTKIATKESKAIQRFSSTEKFFKKGVVKAINNAI